MFDFVADGIHNSPSISGLYAPEGLALDQWDYNWRMSFAGHSSVLVGTAEDACLLVDTSNFNAVDVNTPSAITNFPVETHRPPRNWAVGSFHKSYLHQAVYKSAHFATCEQPELFTDQIRAAIRSLR